MKFAAKAAALAAAVLMAAGLINLTVRADMAEQGYTEPLQAEAQAAAQTQQISDEAVSYLGRVTRMQKDLELHGVEQDGDGYYVRVLRLEDEQMLKFDRNAR